MSPRFITRSIALLLAALFIDASPAGAVTACRVKVDKKTGVIRVDAAGIGGTLLWGPKSGDATTPFYNGASCVAGESARRCELADPTTNAATRGPDDCRIFLDDGVAECSAWISGCTPRRGRGSTELELISAGVTLSTTGPDTFPGVLTCPEGKRVISGGGSLEGAVGYSMRESHPLADGSGWRVVFVRDPDALSPSGSGTIYGFCDQIPTTDW